MVITSEAGNGVSTRSLVAAQRNFVAAQLAAVGFRCCWCEGGSLNLLMKAAALDVLVRRNIFGDREDAIRRFLEAQFLTIIDLNSFHVYVPSQMTSYKRIYLKFATTLSFDRIIRE
jgi:hypothetical protein